MVCYGMGGHQLFALTHLLFTTSVSLGKGRGQHAVIKLQGGDGDA
jgi:hypothetical protein